MQKFKALLCLISIPFILIGCATQQTTKLEPVKECTFPGSNAEAPLWVCDGDVDGISVKGVGRAEKSAAGLDFMKQMAATSARVQLAQQMKVRVQNMIKQYVETTGAGTTETVDKVNTSVTKQITDQTLQGSRIYRTIVAPDGAMYALVGMDEAATKKAAETAIKTSMNNEQALWQQFKAKQGQDELAAAIANQ